MIISEDKKENLQRDTWKPEDILRDTEENGEEMYSEYFEKECNCSCRQKGISIIRKEE